MPDLVELFNHEIKGLYPAGVRTAGGRIEEVPGGLLDEEAAVVAQAAPRRRAEFTAGRVYARSALERLGCPSIPLLPHAERHPSWPEGATGAISHAGGWCAAAVGSSGEWVGIGLDLERSGRVRPQLWPRLFTTAEQAMLAGLDPAQQPDAATLLFSAKECFYKAVYPRVRRHLGFQEVEIRCPGFPCPGSPAWQGVMTDGLQLDGRWTRAAGLICTGALFPRGRA